MRMARGRFLIVTADDFGLHHSVNDAVEQAHRGGFLNAASLMVAEPAAADAIRRAKRLTSLRVGLHLVLADGHSALTADLVPALADGHGHMDAGMFLKSVKFFALSRVRRQLEAEIRAQFRAFARTGLVLDHVNVHKHFHLHPTILEAVLKIGRDYGMTAVRVPDEPLWFALREGAWLAGIQTGLLAPWIALMKRRLRASRVFHNDRMFGIAASGAMTGEKLIAILARLPPGVTEIYLHPATAAGDTVAASMSTYQHAEELAGLLNPRVRDIAAALGIARGGYGDALRERRSA